MSEKCSDGAHLYTASLVAFETASTPKCTWQEAIYFYLHKLDDLHCSGKFSGSTICLEEADVLSPISSECSLAQARKLN